MEVAGGREAESTPGFVSLGDTSRRNTLGVAEGTLLQADATYMAEKEREDMSEPIITSRKPFATGRP